jgi:hypothetical protein
VACLAARSRRFFTLNRSRFVVAHTANLIDGIAAPPSMFGLAKPEMAFDRITKLAGLSSIVCLDLVGF